MGSHMLSHFRFVIVGFVILGVLTPLHFTRAVSLPFGGWVITTKVPGVICNTSPGPIVTKPAGVSPFGPYVVISRTKRYAHQIITPGVWILGTYDPIVSFSLCRTTTTPPIPIPVFKINVYGVSSL